MRALVTGSHGFVGRHFVKRLLLEGWEVTAVDNLVPGTGGRHHNLWKNIHEGFDKTFNPILQDVRLWFGENKNNSFDLVIHLAAIVGGRKVIEGNPLAVGEDLSIDSDFWRWAVEAEPKNIVSFSSSAAYPVLLQGQKESRLLVESDINWERQIGLPDLSYGWVKLTNEFLGRLAHRNYGLSVATYRPFSGYGSDQDANYPFRAICERALSRETDDAGNFYVWGSGLQSRDFVHIDDIVHFVMSTYERLIDGNGVNISSGHLTSFMELASLACRIEGWDPKIVGLDTMPEGVHSRGGDRGVQDSLLRWDRIPLEAGIERCFDHLRSGGI